MRTVEQARADVLSRLSALPPDINALTTSNLGLVLAEDIISEAAVPSFAKAMMDGYGVHLDAPTPEGSRYRVSETLYAGAMGKEVVPGESVRIMTGAPIPAGVNTVVPHEIVRLENDHVVLPLGIVPNQNVLAAGSEFAAGAVALKKGMALGPQHYGVLASVGRTTVKTIPRPLVGVAVTGDELIEPMMRPRGAQIRNTNGPMMLALVTQAGSTPRYLGISRDAPDVIAAAAREGLEVANALVVVGGVSAGDADHVPKVLESLGVEAVFHKVAMRPGKPVYFGMRGSQPVFGLPGNPVSAFVAFHLFVRPALATLAGLPEIPGPIAATLDGVAKADPERESYLPGRSRYEGGRIIVSAQEFRGSAHLSQLATANCLVAVPAGRSDLTAGAEVFIIPLP